MKALILADGALEGWVGGSCAHPVVVTEGLQALREGTPRFISLSPNPQGDRDGVIHHTITCHSGGSLDIYIEPILARPVLLLAGDAPLVGALSEMGGLLGFDVQAAGLPLPLDELARQITQDTCVVVATMGSYDEEALEHVVGSPARYVALVASRRRAETVFAYLESKNVPPERIQRVKVPAGLDIGAVTPEEIALSILAEIIQRRRGVVPESAMPASTEPPAAVQMAIDPICGMSVDPAKAEHTAEFRGVRYFFCSAHCRRTFEREPAAYVPAGA